MNEPSSRSDSSISTSLLKRVKQQDAEAWRRLIQLLGPKVYRWCRKAGLQPADAADVGQEVFRSVLGAIDGFRRKQSGDTFRGWLYRVTHYRIQDYWRKRAKEPAAQGGSTAKEMLARLAERNPAEPAEEASPDEELLLAALDLVREDFQPRTWQAFWLVTIEGLSAQETADQLEMSRGAVYVAKSRVLSRLREELEGIVEFEGVPPRWDPAAQPERE